MEDNILNKYRPQNFDSILGNQSVVQALKRMLASDTKTHAFLFTGSSGCGKTTIARILAKKLGCSDLTTIEINCADKSRREDVRDIIDKIKNRPITGNNLCLILDEASQLSDAAQNTLLKVVEDAPEHVYFIFSSTGIGKMINTLKNRLVKYNMAPLTTEETVSLLTDLWEKERYPVDDKSNNNHIRIIKGIAKKSKGIPREAITLFAKLKTTNIDEAREIIEDYDDFPEAANIIELARMLLALRDGDITWYDLANKYKEIVEHSTAETIRIVSANYLKGCLLKASEEKDKNYYTIILNGLLCPYNPITAEAEFVLALSKIYMVGTDVDS